MDQVTISLWGGCGADTLIGGKGDDNVFFDVEDAYVSGGKGADYFIFEQTVLDFTQSMNEISTADSAY